MSKLNRKTLCVCRAERAQSLFCAEDVVRSAVFSPDGYFVLTATSAGNAKIWNATGLQRAAIKLKGLVTLYGHVQFST